MDTGPIRVVAIGDAPVLADPARRPPDAPARVLAGAIAQGLVRFDASGQIEPGLAQRWTVLADGESYIFRLQGARWANGHPITAGEVVASLKRQIAPGSRNPLAPFLSAVGAITAMTPEVVEIDLTRPRPDLLKLFAQPEMGLMHAAPETGTGPFRASLSPGGIQLHPAADPDLDVDEDASRPRRLDEVTLIAEPAAQAIVDFVKHRPDLVLGGSFNDWPLLPLAGVSPVSVRVDPAAGLFGLNIVTRGGFLADPANRDALSAVLDRPAIAAALGLTATEQIVPETLDSAAAPTLPSWTALALPARRAAARARVAAWRGANPGPITLRVALPKGPGATILWGQIAAALIGIGITPDRVAATAPADLRLIDAVAPYDSARWYLAGACRPCDPQAAAALEAARQAPTPVDRARALAVAESAIVADAPFIPLARPLRWSLVTPRLTQFQLNSRAVHPLNHLRGPPT